MRSDYDDVVAADSFLISGFGVIGTGFGATGAGYAAETFSRTA